MADTSTAERQMTTCDVCGNVYDKAFTVSAGGATYTFDSFECAIQQLAPRCDTCGVTILGHGLEEGSAMYCCANCARAESPTDLRDRVKTGHA